MRRKTTVWIFQASNWRDCIQEDLDMAKNGKLFKRETEPILIAARNIATMANYIKAKILYETE